MTFPSVVSSATTAAASGSTYNVTLPSGISVGDLLVAIIAADNDSAATASGWTKPTNGWGSNGANGNTVWLRKATSGSDALAHVNNSQTRFAHCYCITGWSGTVSDVKVATATTNIIDPPNLSMGSTADYLFVAAARNGGSLSVPTNYNDLITVTFSTVRLSSAWRQLNGSSENPGAFGGTATSSAHSLTIGIPPNPVTTYQGATSLSADSTLTAGAAPIRPAAASLSASATLTAGGAPVRPAGASLAADSALTAGGTRVVPAAADLSATSTLTAMGTSLAPGADLFATSTLTATAVVTRVGATVSMSAEATLTVDTTSEQNADVAMVAEATLTAGAVRVQQASVSMAAEADIVAGTASVQLAAAALVARSSMVAEAFLPSGPPITFFDMAVSLKPPTAHAEPYPLLLGAAKQPNDVRLVFATASGQHDKGAICTMMEMHDNPPTGFSSAYALNPDWETHCVSYQRLTPASTSTAVTWTKPNGWRHFVWATLTARGVDPAVAPIGGPLWVTHDAGSGVAYVAPVSIPAAGAMVFCLGTIPDPGGSSIWPNWAVPLDKPQSDAWKNLVATDKSGATYYEYDTNPAGIVVARNYPAGGSTGTVAFPCGKGSPAFAGLWCFIQAAPDVTISVGAA